MPSPSPRPPLVLGHLPEGAAPSQGREGAAQRPGQPREMHNPERIYRMMQQPRFKEKRTTKQTSVRDTFRAGDPTESHFQSSGRGEKKNPKMKLGAATLCAFVLVQVAISSPVSKGKFFFDGFPKGITISRVTTDQENPPQTTTGYSIRFVPLITLLAGLFPNLMSKLGQFSGVNKYVNTRNPQNATEPLEEEDFEEEEEEGESELIECDASHLGLWPDKSDSQRYYKCEVDPRTPPSANCIKDYFQGKHMDKGDVVPLERIEVPGVKPCFLLSMMKCANGFKYSHKTRICVPDIVFGSQS